MKHVKLIVSLMTLIIFLSCTKVYAEEIEQCEMSPEYEAWLNSDDKESLIEPQYCISDNKKDNIDRAFSVTSLFDITSAVSDSYYNAIDDGIVTSPKNQYENNACWAFTSISLVETQAIKNNLVNPRNLELSSSHLFYNTSRYGFNETLPNTYNKTLTTGGNGSMASAYFFNGQGPVSETYFAHSWDNVYQVLPIANNYTGSAEISIDTFIHETHPDLGMYTCRDFTTTIKEKIVQYGSVGANIVFDGSYMKTVGGNYYYNYYGDETVANHSITIIGWDDSVPASNFKSAGNSGAWIAKNSWGNSWGNGGYFYISYEDLIVCRELFNFEATRLYDYDNAYAASDLNGNLIFSTRDNLSAYVSTKFENVGHEKLSKVSIGVTDNMDYTVFLSRSNNLYDSSDWVLLGSGTSDIKGIKSVYFDEKEVNGSFTIIVKYESTTDAPTSFYAMCSSNTTDSYFYNLNISTGKNYFFSTISYGDKMDLSTYGSTVGSETYSGCENIIYAYTKDEVVTSKNSNYHIEDGLVYVSLQRGTEFTRTDLVNNLIVKGTYKIIDSSNKDVTNSATYIGTNYKIIVNDTDVYNVVVRGDVSGDGKIKSNDALLISRKLVNLMTLTGSAELAGDISGDSILKSNDALLIARFLVGLREVL